VYGYGYDFGAIMVHGVCCGKKFPYLGFRIFSDAICPIMNCVRKQVTTARCFLIRLTYPPSSSHHSMMPPKILTNICHWCPSIAIDDHTGGFLGTMGAQLPSMPPVLIICIFVGAINSTHEHEML